MRIIHSLPPPLRRPAERLIGLSRQRWLLPFAVQTGQAALRRILRPPTQTQHVLFCFCDHYEPEWRSPGPAVGEARVAAWQTGYPKAFAGFRDADGRPPQHSFFFPGEEYRPAYLERLTELCKAGFGEVELHLHHDRDTAAALRKKIKDYLGLLGDHGHFSRTPAGLRYGFIHGNWALANAHGDGADCGVDDELQVLFETGCYADFTFPSAPHPTQPRRINQIYWPTGDLRRARSYEHGETARVGQRHHDRLLMIGGPLALSRRPGRLARPRIDAAAVTAQDPGTDARVRTWVRQGICVADRPEWIFVKVHTHGAPEAQAASLLGPPGQAMHQALREQFNDGERFRLHYVTAREIYNIACAAMDGQTGDPGAFRDYALPPPPVRAAGAAGLRSPLAPAAAVPRTLS